MGHAGVAADHPRRCRDHRAELDQPGGAGEQVHRVEPRHLRHHARQPDLRGVAGDHHGAAVRGLSARHRRPTLGRPASRCEARAGMDQGGAAGDEGHTGTRNGKVQT